MNINQIINEVRAQRVEELATKATVKQIRAICAREGIRLPKSSTKKAILAKKLADGLLSH